MTYQVATAPHPEMPDLTAVTLLSVDHGFEVTFVPAAGMVGASLISAGQEVLGQRKGLAAYCSGGHTFGIPLLAPWANRLVANRFNGVELVTDGTPGVHLDENGRPIHGLLAGATFTVTRCEAVNSGDQPGAWLVAELDFDPNRPEFAAFP
ncbi:MAG: aldose 1-epimerase, partial [Actinomycetes bacterium]